MIVGIGLDVVEVGKVRELLAAQQTFEERVFTPAERSDASRRWGRDGARGCRFCKWKCSAGTAARPGSR